MQNFSEKTVIISQGGPNERFYIIAKGSVVASVNGKTIILSKGDIVGILDITIPVHSCSYIAAEDCVLIPYEYQDVSSLMEILNANPDLRKLFILSFCRSIGQLIKTFHTVLKQTITYSEFIMDVIHKYQDICHNLGLLHKTLAFMDTVDNELKNEDLPFYLEEYFLSTRKMITESSIEIPSNYSYGFLVRCQDDIATIMDLQEKLYENQSKCSSYLLNEDYLDLFDLYCDLYTRAVANHAETQSITDVIEKIINKLKVSNFCDPELLQKRLALYNQKVTAPIEKIEITKEDENIRKELSASLDIIFDYADSVDATKTNFKKQLSLYKQLSDKNATEREADSIRKHLTKLFYLIYNECIQMNLKGKKLPTIVKMFLNFGYIDPELCGYQNAVELYKLAENYHGVKEQGIYTLYEWILEIYAGNKQPSRNEFDMDYSNYIRTLKREGKIDAVAEEAMSQDQMSKVMFELQNMFTQVNKVTFGRVLSYCPILIEENIIKPFQEMMVTAVKIIEQFDYFKSIDYSAFYHDILFEDSKVNVKETLYLDIRPDVILMPNIGSKGILWQEIEGMHRNTAGRMMISAFHIEQLPKTFARMIGEFRWEMCKRDMGARWNDFSIHSLTGDYCDYAQFFPKNRELTYNAKDKIKTALKHCRNNYKEMFLMDYTTFVLHESTGSCRLNKVVRSILFNHCPFTKEICASLNGNGAFQDLLNRHHIKQAQALHRFNQIQLKYQNAQQPFPDELKKQLLLLDQ